MSQCEKKSMVIQGIKDRSKGAETKVKQEKQEKEAGKDLEVGVHETKGRSRGDPGKIQRSKEFGVQGCRRKYGKGDKEERCWHRGQGVGVRTRERTGKERGKGGTRTIECGGVLGSLVGSDEGD